MKATRMTRFIIFSTIMIAATAFIASCSSGGKSSSAPKSSNTQLAGLSISNCGTASFSFDPGTLSYGPFSQGFGVASYTLTAVKAEDAQTVVINGEASLQRTGDLTVGTNNITVDVTAADGVTTARYAVSVVRAEQGATPPTDSSDLTNVVVTTPDGTTVTFDNPISPDTHEYNGTAPNSAGHISLGDITVPAGATTTITVNGVAYTGDITSIPLNEGDNVIVVIVHGADGYDQTYVFNIRRQTTTADLAGLTLLWNGVTQNQITFSNSTAGYDLTGSKLDYTITSCTIKATKTNSYQSVKINSVEATDKIIPLSIGDNTIIIKTTAEDGAASETFTIKLFRRGNNTPANIELLCSGVNFTFNAATNTYTYPVGYDVSTATIKVSQSDTSQTITINDAAILQKDISLAAGANTITVKVTASGASDNTYTITLNKASDTRSVDSTLSAINMTGIVLIPSFDKNRTEYSAEVDNSIASTTVQPVSSSATSTIKINGTTAATADVNLAVGINTITINVAAENTDYSSTYTVTVYRANGTQSNNSALFSIAISPTEAQFGTVFNPNILGYTSNVLNNIDRVSVSPQRAEITQIVKVNGVKIDYSSADISVPVDLTIGINNVNIVVTAEDGISTRTYTLIFNRAATGVSNDANLTGLTITNPAADLTPVFYKNRLEYTAIVNADAASVNVTPLLSDSTNGSVTVNLATASSGSASTVALGDKGSNTVIKITVTAQDKTTRTYTVIVNRATDLWSNNAKLSSLSLSTGTLLPSFSASVIDYVANVDSTKSSVIVTASQAVSGGNAKILYNGNSSTSIALGYGKNIIEVKSLAQDGISTMTYTIQVNRREAGLTVYFKMPTEWKGFSNRAFIVYTTGSSVYTAAMTQLDAKRDWWSYTIVDATSASGITFQNSYSNPAQSQSAGTRTTTGYYSYSSSWAWSETLPTGFPAISVSATPRPDSGDYAIPFKDTKEITLNAGGENIEFCKYTLDGTDPATSATANYFINNMKLIIGQNVAVTDPSTVITLKLYAKNSSNAETTGSFLYQKTGKQMTVHVKRPKTWATTSPVIHMWVVDPTTHVNLWNITGWKLDPDMTAEGSGNWYSYTIDGLDSCGMMFLENNSVADASSNITTDQTFVTSPNLWFILNGVKSTSTTYPNRGQGTWYSNQAAADTAAAALTTLY